MAPAQFPYRPNLTVTQHCISSGHYLASGVGHEILQRGGNAIDAGVAAGIAINVVAGIVPK
jgi:gamma-glutamyltranspeptidase/glutathione hydrolase